MDNLRFNLRGKKSKFFCVLYLVIGLLGNSGFVLAEPESNEVAFQEWAYFPAVAYNAETGLLLGGLAVQFFEAGSINERTSSIDYLVTATTNQQYSLLMAPNFYFNNNSIHIESHVEIKDWVANFYEIGNDSADVSESYETSGIEIKFSAEKEMFSSSYFGGILHLKQEDIILEPGGILESSQITGTRSGLQAGIGFLISYDTRDNNNDARQGSYAKYNLIDYKESIDSDFEYTLQELKLASYFRVNLHSGVAIGAYFRSVRGEVPFRSLSSPDGIRVLRGIENGRYRDRDLASFQSEYRFPIKAKWGGVAFAELAQVANQFSEITTDGWKSSVGAGLRWALNHKEKLNLRLDVSYVDDSMGLVLEIRDAF